MPIPSRPRAIRAVETCTASAPTVSSACRQATGSGSPSASFCRSTSGWTVTSKAPPLALWTAADRSSSSVSSGGGPASLPSALSTPTAEPVSNRSRRPIRRSICSNARPAASSNRHRESWMAATDTRVLMARRSSTSLWSPDGRIVSSMRSGRGRAGSNPMSSSADIFAAWRSPGADLTSSNLRASREQTATV